jgi:hypothetical protein
MKKITLLLIFSLLSFVGFSQGLPLEGFENTSSGPDLSTNPSEWTLDTGTLGNQWMVFDNGVGTGQRWDIYNSPAANVYAGVNSASINRENVGQGNTSEDYLATPLITVPTNGRLRFWTRTGTNGPQGNCFYQIKIAPATAVQNNPAEYTLLQQWNETSLTTTFNIYEEKIVDLSAYANQSVYIAFVMVLTQPSFQVPTSTSEPVNSQTAIDLSSATIGDTMQCPTNQTSLPIFKGLSPKNLQPSKVSPYFT